MIINTLLFYFYVKIHKTNNRHKSLDVKDVCFIVIYIYFYLPKQLQLKLQLFPKIEEKNILNYV